MALRVQHQCPQCGAGIEFAEADHFLVCGFCGVRSFMYSTRYFRFMFQPRITGEAILYAPYLHFKGSAFFFQGTELGHKSLNLSQCGVVSRVLPPSVGFRSQTQKLQIISPDTAGTFLRFELEPSDMLESAIQAVVGEKTHHHVYIGEFLSLIYLPLVLRGQEVLDGVSGTKVAQLNGKVDLAERALASPPSSDLRFIGALCPACGWNLDGEGASVVLTCRNCDTAWEPEEGRLVARPVETVPTRGGRYVYLPFWRMTVNESDPPLARHLDFLRFIGRWDSAGVDSEAPAHYWSPAFKIRPRALLRMGSRLTRAQPQFPGRPDLPAKHHHPITLPSREAAEALPLFVAALAMNRRDLFPRLQNLRLEPKERTLVYLPFREEGGEMVLPEMQLGVSPSALDFGRYL